MAGIKLKDVAKIFSKRFACSASVVDGIVPGSLEIAVQGDLLEEMADYVAEKMKEVCLSCVVINYTDTTSVQLYLCIFCF